MYKAISLCLLVVFVLAHVHADDHNINDCLNPGTKPTLLLELDIRKPAEGDRCLDEYIKVPLEGFAPNKITCLSVLNLDTDDNGGYPKITSGGVGDFYVILNFKSQCNKDKGYHFEVAVYYDADNIN